MLRTVAALVALAILPGLATAQEAGAGVAATHTVTAGETLWDLAQRYYGNPFEWPRIHEANRGLVADPHRILPGQQLTIPSATATVQAVVVTEPSQPMPMPMPMEPRAAGPSIFFLREEERTAGGVATARPALPAELVYAAPWLVPLEGEVAHTAELTSLTGGDAALRRTLHPFDRVEMRFVDAPPPVGTRLQLFRVDRELEDVGRVAIPTGLVTVTELVAGGAIALVTDQFELASAGDLARPLPAFSLRPGQMATEVSAREEAVVVGFASDHAIRSVGDEAFLDRGSDDGVRIGDEFVAVYTDDPEFPGRVEGTAQVVAVQPGFATVRIMELRHPVFREGLVVRLTRRIP